MTWPVPIPVSERLPEHGVTVLGLIVWSDTPNCYGSATWATLTPLHDGDRNQLFWVDDLDPDIPLGAEVSHWLPLPPSP